MARDIYPARVVMVDGRAERACRVFVTSQRVVVYRLSAGRIVRLAEHELAEGSSVAPDRSSLMVGRSLEVETSDGVLVVEREAGCGCGSPLKALGPPIEWGRRG